MPSKDKLRDKGAIESELVEKLMKLNEEQIIGVIEIMITLLKGKLDV